MSGKYLLTDRMPGLRTERGLVFLDVDHRDGMEVAVTMHDFERFLEAGRRLAVDWHQAQIVPLRRRRKTEV